MKVSSRTKYGLRAAFELALNYGNGPLQLRVIAKAQDISVKYLEHLMSNLRAGGIVKSIRGAKGGYTLAKKPAQIDLYEIFLCLEGRVETADCVYDSKTCKRSADCVAMNIWVEVKKAIEKVLGSVTLQDMVDKAKKNNKLDFQI